MALIFSAFVKSIVAESPETHMDVIAFQSYRDGSVQKSQNIALKIVDQNKLFKSKELSFFNDFYDCIIRVGVLRIRYKRSSSKKKKSKLTQLKKAWSLSRWTCSTSTANACSNSSKSLKWSPLPLPKSSTTNKNISKWPTPRSAQRMKNSGPRSHIDSSSIFSLLKIHH